MRGERKKIVRVIVAVLAVLFAVAGVVILITAPRSLGLPVFLGVLLVVAQFVTFAVTGVSPFRADQLRELREKRAARNKATNL